MSEQHGHTLAEILIIIALISVISITAIPKTVAFFNVQQLDKETACFVSELRYLQELSRTICRQHSDFLAVPAEPAPELVFFTGGYLIKKNNKAIHIHNYPDGMTSRHNRNSIMFSPDGDAEPMTVTFRLGSQYKDIIIDSVGRIRVQ